MHAAILSHMFCALASEAASLHHELGPLPLDLYNYDFYNYESVSVTTLEAVAVSIFLACMVVVFVK
jgi:hypothetical protein